MKRDLNCTESLEYDFVEGALKSSTKSMIMHYIMGIFYILLLSFLTFQSITFMQNATKVRESSLNVEKQGLYKYQRVEFSN